MFNSVARATREFRSFWRALFGSFGRVEKIDRGLAPGVNSLGHEQRRNVLVFHVTTATRSMHAAHRFPHAIIGKEPTRPQAVGELYVTRWRAPQE